MMEPIKIQCGRCGQPVDAEINPQHKIINLTHSSMLVIEHSGQTTCRSCGETVEPVMAGMQGLMMLAKPVAPQQREHLIVTP